MSHGDAQASVRELSGRKTLLFVLLLGPLLLVPLLLTGRAAETEVCLICLQQRQSVYWTVGSFALQKPQWHDLEAWPRTHLHAGLPALVGGLPEAGPAEWALRMQMHSHDHVFLDTERTLPFALVIGIPNRRALGPSREQLLEVRLLAAAVLDPDDEQDRECHARLDESLRAGLERLAGARGRRARRAGPVEAERSAEHLLAACLAAIDGSTASAQAVRGALCSHDDAALQSLTPDERPNTLGASPPLRNNEPAS